MFNVMKYRSIFLGIALVLVLASIASIVFVGFNLDTDFAGGMAVTYKIDSEFTVADVEAITNEALGSDQSPSSVQKSGGNEVVIKFGLTTSLKQTRRVLIFRLKR